MICELKYVVIVYNGKSEKYDGDFNELFCEGFKNFTNTY